MASALRTRWEVLARLAMSCALLWLACGERPEGGDSALRRKGSESQALQDTSTWSTTGALATARSGHTATLLSSGKVLVTGGYRPSGSLASAEVYDPATGTWSTTGALATARIAHTATLLPSGKVLVTGGYGPSGSLASAEVYDPAMGTWSTTSALAMARSSHTATLLPSGKVLVTGGVGSDGSYLASAEVYDPAMRTWSTTSALATARTAHTATLLPSGKVLVTGGVGSDGSSLASAEVYQVVPVVLTPANGSTLNNNRPTYTGTEEAVSTVSVMVDGTAVGSTTASASGEWAFLQPVALVDGPHMVMATAAGSNTHAESHANAFAVDTTPPAAPVVLTPANGSILDNHQPTYSGTAEPGSTVSVTVDGTAVGSTTTNASGEWALIQPVALVAGSHRVKASATDAAGNTASAEYSFSIPKGNYRWGCATAPSFPVAWALLALACSLRRRPHRAPRGGTH